MKGFDVSLLPRDNRYASASKKIKEQKGTKGKRGIIKKRGEKIKAQKREERARATAPGAIDTERFFNLTGEEGNARLLTKGKGDGIAEGDGDSEERKEKETACDKAAHSFFLGVFAFFHALSLLLSFLIIITQRGEGVKTCEREGGGALSSLGLFVNFLFFYCNAGDFVIE